MRKAALMALLLATLVGNCSPLLAGPVNEFVRTTGFFWSNGYHSKEGCPKRDEHWYLPTQAPQVLPPRRDFGMPLWQEQHPQKRPAPAPRLESLPPPKGKSPQKPDAKAGFMPSWW